MINMNESLFMSEEEQLKPLSICTPVPNPTSLPWKLLHSIISFPEYFTLASREMPGFTGDGTGDRGHDKWKDHRSMKISTISNLSLPSLRVHQLRKHSAGCRIL